MLFGRKSLQLLPNPGRQGQSAQASLSFSDIWNCPDHTWRFYVLVASGAAADARGLRTGSGSLLRFGRGLRDGQPRLPVLSLHAGGEAQRPESYVPAHRQQAGEGTQWENSVEYVTGCVFTGGLSHAGHVVVPPDGGSGQQRHHQCGHRVRAAHWDAPGR